MTEKQKFMRVCASGFLFNLVLASAAVSFYFFFIRPAYAEFLKTNQELFKLEQGEISLRSSLREVEQRSDDLEHLRAAFLDVDNAIPFITLLESAAARSNVFITIRSIDDKNTSNTKEAHFNISVTGRFQHMMQFMKLVENMPYFASISILTITSQNTPTEHADITLSMLTL